MILLFHANDDSIVEIVDGAMYTLIPNEPNEIENEFHAQKILERLPWAGIVQVQTVKTKGGVKYDIDAATEEAMEARHASEDKMITEYVTIQMEERVRHGRPVLPPEGRVAAAILSRNIDLGAKYNLFPVGWDKDGATLAAAGGSPEETKALRERNEQLEAELAQQRATTDAILKALPPKMAEQVQKNLDEQAEAEKAESGT